MKKLKVNRPILRNNTREITILHDINIWKVYLIYKCSKIPIPQVVVMNLHTIILYSSVSIIL